MWIRGYAYDYDSMENMGNCTTGHLTLIGSAHRPDPNLANVLTQRTREQGLCLVLANCKLRNLEARVISKYSRLAHGVTDLDSSILK